MIFETNTGHAHTFAFNGFNEKEKNLFEEARMNCGKLNFLENKFEIFLIISLKEYSIRNMKNVIQFEF